jgi:16S rRNA (guanine1207-N2)-methyltransferase
MAEPGDGASSMETGRSQQSHYFDVQPAGTSRPSTVELAIPGMRLELAADRGVFSAGGVDPGTVELLKLITREDRVPPGCGDLLDLGCGYGPIACVLAKRHPDRLVWAVDINRRAIDLTSANAGALGLGNIRACGPDDVPSGVALAGIWSNPPIRIGKPALHSVLLRWLARLSQGADASLVVHRHLGADSLAEWLGGEGWHVERLASKKGYRILRVRAA